MQDTASTKTSQRISLLIDGTKVSLQVRPQEEAIYRRAAERLNKRIQQYRSEYLDSTDPAHNGDFFRLMVALDMALQLESQLKLNDSQPVEAELSRLCAELQSLLTTQPKE